MWTLLALSTLTASGADKAPRSDEAAQIETEYDHPRLHAAVMTMNGVFPGVRLGVELPLVLDVRDRKPKRRDFRKHGIGEIVVRPNAGFWIEPRNANNVFLGGEAGLRWTTHRGFRLGSYLGVNYLHAFNGGMTYNANEPGDVRPAPMAGNPGFLGMATLGLGTDWKKKKQNPFSVDFRAGAWVQAPFNNFILPGVMIELDVGWRFKP